LGRRWSVKQEKGRGKKNYSTGDGGGDRRRSRRRGNKEKHQAMKTYGSVEIKLHAFLTLALN
jgi:hypothetical protein